VYLLYGAALSILYAVLVLVCVGKPCVLFYFNVLNWVDGMMICNYFVLLQRVCVCVSVTRFCTE